MLGEVRDALVGRWRTVTNPVGRFLVNWMNSMAGFNGDDIRDAAQEEAREQFLEIFAKRSWRYIVFGTGLVLFGVAVADMMTCGTLQNQTYGLALDLTGAVILGRGLIKGPVRIAKESEQVWGYSPPVIKSLSRNAVDGIFGVTFLIVGILLQFVAITHMYPSLLPDIQSLCSAIQ